MRILHVMPHYYPAVRYGGPIRSVQGLAAATAALGHEVHVYTTNIDGEKFIDVPTCVPVDLNGVKVSYFPVRLGRGIYRSPAMGHALDKTISSFDVVHIHYVWVWTTICAASAARRHRVPYILAPRGMLVADLMRRRNYLAKLVWLYLFARRDVARAAAIHATSDVEAEEFRVLNMPFRVLALIPNGVDLFCAEQATLDVLTSENTGLNKLNYVLFLGRISWKKGLDRLIRSFRLVEKYDLIVAGYDECGYEDALKKLALDCGVAERVKFIGPVEGKQKDRLISEARLLVLPSYNENFGLVVLEAMAAGRPVVVTKGVGLSRIVEETGSGLVSGDEIDDIANALNYVLLNPEKGDAMGQAGRHTVQEHFSWHSVAKKALELYEACRI